MDARMTPAQYGLTNIFEDSWCSVDRNSSDGDSCPQAHFSCLTVSGPNGYVSAAEASAHTLVPGFLSIAYIRPSSNMSFRAFRGRPVSSIVAVKALPSSSLS
ncbi:hypothetical protein NPIL_145461 [Nephila pilipes]|uniref:Uncharacterized protein n=1 Tax=Nephila pilipes TaxID=299642 RepID=A0A8X6TSJ4_NEPPI|nr:hypothetical protein NPIL_145461 [Nephila pilipes]